MDNEFEFSTAILPELKGILESMNLSEALEYHKDSQDKILFAILDLNFFYHIIDEKKDAYTKWNKKLFKNKMDSGLIRTTITYLGQDIPSEILLNKVSMNFFTSLHSFFDNYAHFMYICLFPNECIPEKLNFYDVYYKIKKNNKYKNIENKIDESKDNDYFRYISAIDNINKHRSIIAPQSTIWMNDGKIEIEIPEFKKEKKTYKKLPMIDAIEDSLNLVNNFSKDVSQEILSYLTEKV